MKPNSAAAPAYAELHCLSNFTFLRGASHPEELVVRAAQLGYRALALTDECSVAGVVRAHLSAKAHGLQLIIGSEFYLREGLKLVVLACNRHGYGALSALITRARRRSDKGHYSLSREDFTAASLAHCLVLWMPTRAADQHAADWLKDTFAGRAWIGVELLLCGHDREQLKQLMALGRTYALPLAACGDVHMHTRTRRILQDTLTAIRLKQPLAAVHHRLYPNGERHLRSRARLARLYPQELLRETVAIAARCRFSLDELRYEYPDEIVPAGKTPTEHLREAVHNGAKRRWPAGTPHKARRQIEHELDLIAELNYEPYFLTVYDIVTYARRRGILCQGRGSAANSAVCFCLGITELDPARSELLFERFVSRERREPPDIDVDFEHQRREEVIQYIYRKYGRERAALAATLITYRLRSAVRDVGKALGLEQLEVERLARAFQWWDAPESSKERLRESGLNPDSTIIRRLIKLVRELVGFPRHLSQHVGGLVISRGPLSELVPIENATMPERTVIQWDKNDLNELGLLKIDVLALGMLSALRRALALVNRLRGSDLTLATIPAKDRAVYAMIQRADTIGVFQIESRAQMTMLPRLRPARFYDLVIEVAIVRPGPIQGDMVHPYLARRCGEAPVTYPSEAVKRVLQRTLGVPIFQEQVMQLAMVAAGFTPDEADRLRRAMAAWRHHGSLEPFQQKLIDGMRQYGYPEEFARQIYRQIRGFGEYGFPESHAASFALLVYVSAWLKRHEPAAFTCALLNSQPMGFYAPAQLVQDARRHGVMIRPVEVTASRWECTLEPDAGARQSALRLGLNRIKGIGYKAVQRIVKARDEYAFKSATDLARRAHLSQGELNALAAAGALHSLAGNRYHAYWQVLGIDAPLALGDAPLSETTPLLAPPSEGDDIAADYASLGLTLGRHPIALLRPHLAKLGLDTIETLRQLHPNRLVSTAGLVTHRQRPGSAKGVVFMSLEDETGHINIIVWQRLAEAQRKVLLGAQLMQVTGVLQHQDGIFTVLARELGDHNRLLGNLIHRSRDFH